MKKKPSLLLLSAVAGAGIISTAEPLCAQDIPLVGPKLRAPENTVTVPTTRPADRLPLTGDVEVVVQLTKPSLASRQADAILGGAALSGDAQRNYLNELNGDQAGLLGSLNGLGARRLALLRKGLNAIVVTVDAKRIPDIAKLPGVHSVRVARNYQLDLSETVPYIGAAAVQAAGITGAGVRVAVLDSGIDYTHKNLGGPGTAAAYAAAYGTGPGDPKNQTLDGLFPTAKVIGGTDFVGEVWPNGPLQIDPDPIDYEGHGTHVADIIAGQSLDGTHVGVAPGAKLYAVKVCSAVSSSCSGIALLNGIDYALDPNGDGDISDHVDVVNMSLGSSYGQIEDDLSEASANAVRLGVTVVASAGNSADRPYIVGSPSSTPELISVAQTTVPSDKAYALVVNNGSAAGTYRNTATVPFPDSLPVGTVTAPVLYVGRGCPAAGATPADPLPAGVTEADVAGKIVLIDRGSCSISLKIDRFADLGAKGALIANNVSGDPPSFSFGGPDTYNGVPTLVLENTLAFGANSPLRQALTAAAANGTTVSATISDANVTPLVGSMVSSSSRGPSISFQAIKPDIGAPGASVSAIAGSGTGQEAFGGTSGAAPMVAGSAALLKQAFPDASPLVVKSRLMNNAYRDVKINPATQPGVLAPITRIGAGEVRVNNAVNAGALAYVLGAPDAPSLSFGFDRLSGPRTYTKTVRVRNLRPATRTFNVSSAFRYADDTASGAVAVNVPGTVTVPGNSTADFIVTLTVDAAKLPNWTLNGGARGGDGFRLQGVEFDGFVQVAEGADNLALPFHILPHKAAGTRAASSSVTLTGGTGSVAVTNTPAATDGGVDVFNLLGTSPRVPTSTLPKPGGNFAIVDYQSVGARVVNFGTAGAPDYGLQFAVTSYDSRAHPAYPAEYDVYLDLNGDGTDDYRVYNSEQTGFGATGVTLVNVQNLNTTTAFQDFYLDADLDSANAILSVRFARLGLAGNAIPATPIRLTFRAYDNYFTGDLTDSIGPVTYTPALPKYAFSLSANPVPVGGSATLTINAVPGGATASPSQTGALLLYRDARAKAESQAINVSP